MYNDSIKKKGQEDMKKYTVGVDIGGTKCAAVLGKGSAAESEIIEFILDKEKIPTTFQDGPEGMIEQIFQMVETLLLRNHVELDEIVGIGISCGGPLDHEKGVILSPPNLMGWDHVEIVKMFEERFQVPCFLENDANAGALAEYLFGAAKGCKNVIFLTYGTGMGAGLILDGKLYHGTNDMAGEAGHIRLTSIGPVGYGKAGSFEGMCSGAGIAQLAKIKATELLQAGTPTKICPDIKSLETLTAKSIAEAAKAGDEFAKQIFEISGEYLGAALAVLIDILNPEMIVCGSVFTRSQELLWDSAVEVLKREALARSLEVCRVVKSGLGESIGDFAALSIVLSYSSQQK